MTTPLQVLIVDDDVVDRKDILRHLTQTTLSVETQETASAEESLTMMALRVFDCILLDYRLPEMSGIDFLVRLQELSADARPATVMLTGSGNERLVVQAMRLGVQDYLVKDGLSPADLENAILNAVETCRRQRAEEAENRRIEQLALVDPVTGIGNRNLFNMRFQHAIRCAQREKEELALLYLDLDRFKEINDTLGHAAGDQVLREVAHRLKATARDADTVARLSGDEFAVIMETSVSQAGAERFAARVKRALTQPMMIGGQAMRITCSIGVAFYPEDADNADTLMHAADINMYEAKFGRRLDLSIARQVKRP